MIKVFLPYMGMVAILINKPWPFEQIFNPPLTEGSTWSLKKIGPKISEEKPFKSVDEQRTDWRMYGWTMTDDKRQMITSARQVPFTQVS